MKLDHLRKLLKSTPSVDAPRSENELTQVDQLFRDQLSGHQVQPRQDHWANIESQLGTHSWLHKHLWRLCIAAIVLLLLSSSKFLCHRTHQLHAAPVANITPTPALPDDLSLLQAGTLRQKKTLRRPYAAKKERQQTRIEELFAELMADPDEFKAVIDEKRVQHSLEPSERLPMEGLASISTTLPETPVPHLAPSERPIPELTIMIPLQLVESEAEAQQLLDLYVKKQQDQIKP